MNDCTLKRRNLIILILLIFLISGCETIGAMRSGNLTMRDITRMCQMGSGGETGAGGIESGGKIEEGEPIEAIAAVIKKADTWFRDNLW